VTPRYLADRLPGVRRLHFLLACAALTLPLGGCATFWDEAFSRERDLGAYFNPPDPLIVIRDSTDGERRAKALASLREPVQKGGNAQDQEAYLQILTTAARTDRDPLCRLGAIQALGHFTDPRAARALEEVYQQTKLPFTQDFNTMIRQTALTALEKTGNDASLQLLILVARQPGPAQDASSADRRQTQDEKLIAIRALGKYHQPECIETLVYILESEKDAALRDRANQSLRAVTGKNLPPDPQVWRTALAGQPVNPATSPGVIERVSGWFK
jgi:HEAT repeat protein